MGLHQAVALCMEHCVAYDNGTSDDGWYKTIILAGGTSCLAGLPGNMVFLLYPYKCIYPTPVLTLCAPVS